MKKQFKLAAQEIKPLVRGCGGCVASDLITVEGYPVRFMYRESPDNDADSGWRFMSGFEDDEYTSNSNNFEMYDINTIANYDPSIVPFLDSPIGSAFEKTTEAERFVRVSDWEVPAEE
jgi:hypothetical protein